VSNFIECMDWINLLGKGIFSGAVIVAASELAKKSTIFGALVISLPLASIMSMTWLYNDTKDNEQVADFAESILWLVIPSMILFLTLPFLLRRGWEFEYAMSVGIVLTIIAYAASIGLAKSFGSVS
jgi:mannose/fructose/N-acetylgalactosamine-specific phosphotransferase system component IID